MSTTQASVPRADSHAKRRPRPIGMRRRSAWRGARLGLVVVQIRTHRFSSRDRRPRLSNPLPISTQWYAQAHPFRLALPLACRLSLGADRSCARQDDAVGWIVAIGFCFFTFKYLFSQSSTLVSSYDSRPGIGRLMLFACCSWLVGWGLSRATGHSSGPNRRGDVHVPSNQSQSSEI